jgi:hypothetical protein
MLCTALNGFGSLEDGLVGHWPLNGDALDVSGNGYHGTLLSGASFVTNPEGSGQALQASLGDQHTGHVLVGLPSSVHPSQGETGFLTSGSVWVMFDDRQGMSHEPNWQSVLGHPPGLTYLSRYMTHNQIRTMVRNHNNTQNAWPHSATASVTEEERWYHIAWTFHSHNQGEEGHLRWYIDGKLSSEYTGGLKPSGTNTFRIGADYSARAANTKIAEVRLYDRILTPTEIQQLASAADFSSIPQYPQWWEIPSETSQQFDYVLGIPESDFAPLLLGQLKYMADKARNELDTVLAPIGGAGPEISTMVDAFTQNDPADYAPANLGQLKYVAAPFYNRLVAIGFSTWPTGMTFNSSGYPWTENVTSQNLSPANLGQLKYLFSWQLPAGFVDPQPGEFPQWWIDQHFPGQTYVDPDADPDGDGLTNWEEFLLGGDPITAATSVSSSSVGLHLLSPR